MGRKRKRKQKQAIFCYYCDRDFDNEKILIQHQRAKHFKCHVCHKRLGSAHGMMVHVFQVHKQNIDKVPGAKEGQDSFDITIFGMAGVPTEMIDQKLVEQGEPPTKKQKTNPMGLTHGDLTNSHINPVYQQQQQQQMMQGGMGVGMGMPGMPMGMDMSMGMGMGLGMGMQPPNMGGMAGMAGMPIPIISGMGGMPGMHMPGMMQQPHQQLAMGMPMPGMPLPMSMPPPIDHQATSMTTMTTQPVPAPVLTKTQEPLADSFADGSELVPADDPDPPQVQVKEKVKKKTLLIYNDQTVSMEEARFRDPRYFYAAAPIST